MSDLTLAINDSFHQCLRENYERELPQIKKQFFDRIFDDSLEEMSLNSHLTTLYDYCIIASEADSLISREISEKLSHQFHIVGCLYEDVAIPGKSIFETYEDMIERSSKILFLITKNFTKDSFCVRIQNATVFQTVVDRATKSREKCVPLILESSGNMKLPLAMTGITGIKYNDSMDVSPILLNTFAQAPRKREIMQKRFQEKNFKALVDKKVNEVLADQKSKTLQIASWSKLAGGIANSSAFDQFQALLPNDMQSKCMEAINQAMTFQQHSNCEQKCLGQSATSSATNPAQQVEVSNSKYVRVGNQVTYNIILNGEKHLISESSETSDSESGSEVDDYK